MVTGVGVSTDAQKQVAALEGENAEPDQNKAAEHGETTLSQPLLSTIGEPGNKSRHECIRAPFQF